MFDKEGTYIGVGTVSSINGVGKIGQEHAKEWNYTTNLHHTQEQAQNGQELNVSC